MADFRWITRRDFLTYSGVAGAAAVVAPHLRLYERGGTMRAVMNGGGTLDPGDIDKFVSPLVVPPAMPRLRKVRVRGGKNIDYYEIAVRQFRQQILPAGHPATTVWGYGAGLPRHLRLPVAHHRGQWEPPVRVKWINGLRDPNGRSCRTCCRSTRRCTGRTRRGPGGTRRPEPAGAVPGPVPMVTHVHGAHTTEDSDGYPEAWYLPDGHATSRPGYAPGGHRVRRVPRRLPGAAPAWTGHPGSAAFQYPNDQRAATLWYHDHTLGHDPAQRLRRPGRLLPAARRPERRRRPARCPARRRRSATRRERGTTRSRSPSRTAPSTRTARSSTPTRATFFDGFAGALHARRATSRRSGTRSSSATRWSSTAGPGRSWRSSRGRYRFRLLNGCNSRFLILRMDDNGRDASGRSAPRAASCRRRCSSSSC